MVAKGDELVVEDTMSRPRVLLYRNKNKNEPKGTKRPRGTSRAETFFAELVLQLQASILRTGDPLKSTFMTTFKTLEVSSMSILLCSLL